MGTRVVRIAGTGWCVWKEEGLFPLVKQPLDHRALFMGFDLSIRDERIDPLGARYLSPLDPPCQIICQGKNYLAHLLETGVRPENKEYNLLFTKAPSCLAPPVGELRRPERVELLDYELELGLVMKRRLTAPVNITEDNLLDYVGALVMANDVSARDVQVPERQWFKGKSFRGFCPVGPVLYFPDPSEAKDILNLELELKVNGQVRQKSNTKLLMYRPAETLTEISGIFDLYPGDLLLTGTPGGVAMKVEKPGFLSKFWSEKKKMEHFLETQRQSPRYLKPGDEIRSTIRSQSIDLGEQCLGIV